MFDAIPYLTSFLSLVVSVIALYNQRSLYRLQHFNLKYTVYASSQKLYNEFCKGDIKSDTMNDFTCAVASSRFIFQRDKKKEIHKFLDSVHKAAVCYKNNYGKISEIDDKAVREIIYNDLSAAINLLSGFPEVLSKKITSHMEL